MTDVRFKLVSSKEALIFSKERIEVRESTVIAYILLGVVLYGDTRELSSLVKIYRDGIVRNELQRPKLCLLRIEVKGDPHMFLLGSVIKWKHIGTSEAEFCYKSKYGFDFTVDLTADLSTDEFNSACKLSLGAVILDLLAE